MQTAELGTPLAALAAGLATSFHCAGMCGPLVCAVRAKPFAYHLSRVVSYALAGLALGSAGFAASAALKGSIAHLVPWGMAAVLLVLGLGLEKRIPQPPAFAGLTRVLRLDRSLGILTPLLPCGPLWLMYGVAAISGSPFSGAALMAAFALGTIPVFAVIHAGAFRGGRFLPSSAFRWFQQGIALCGAAILVWRALMPATVTSCCH